MFFYIESEIMLELGKANEKYLDAEEIATALNISAYTARLWCREKKFKAVKIGRKWYVSKTQIDELVNEKN